MGTRLNTEFFILACAALLISVSSAFALECAKAGSPIDLAICADAGLRAQDAELTRLYFSTLRRLSGASHKLLQEDQRYWLKARSENCQTNTHDIVSCLKNETAKRIASIPACFNGPHPDPEARGISCAVKVHASCPLDYVGASASIWSYPFLVELVEKIASSHNIEREEAELCAPASESSGSPDQNEDLTGISMEGSGKGWVAIRKGNDGYSRGAAHPWHSEDVTTYHSAIGTPFTIAELMPKLVSDAKASRALWDAASEHLEIPCCGDEDDVHRRKLDDLMIMDYDAKAVRRPLPTAWLVEAGGKIKVFYEYIELGRTFVATSVLQSPIIYDLIDPKYASLFARKD